MGYLLMRLNAHNDGDGKWTVTLRNGASIDIEQTKAAGWDVWKIGGQCFTYEDNAADYLKRIIAEKLTGVRIAYHECCEVPMICDGGCLHPDDKGSRALCNWCPLALEDAAARDGLKLVYAV